MSLQPHQLVELITALHHANLSARYARQARPPSAVDGFAFPRIGAVYQACNNLGNALRYTPA